MSFNPINKVTSSVIPLPIDNIDTDQIIPARFLKATNREGFGNHLFDAWRYSDSGEPNPDFILNTPSGRGEILLAGENFGCGSSREHAAWALYDYGIRSVIAKSFADIHRNNELNNGMIPVELPENEWQQLKEKIEEVPDTTVEIDLIKQEVRVESELTFTFEINPFKKQCLIEGTDLVDYLINQHEKITTFEQRTN